MKLRLLLLGSFIAISNLALGTAVDQMEEFLKMEGRHKKDWYDYMDMSHKTKNDLMEHRYEEMIMHKIRFIKAVSQLSNCSDMEKNELLMNTLRRAIASCKQFMAKARAVYTELFSEGSRIASRHERELDNFEKSLGMSDMDSKTNMNDMYYGMPMDRMNEEMTQLYIIE